MQKISKKGFTLIEVIVATSILSITVFGIYKMISENLKIISNSEKNLQVENIYEISKACIDYIEQKGNISAPTFYLDFGNDLLDCKTNITEKLNTLDNIDYSIGVSKSSSGAKINVWDLKITSDYSKVEKKYIQKK